eukprot:COSAG01_NODE_20899_length_929_cov_0.765060_2_plen_25_part_01
MIMAMWAAVTLPGPACAARRRRRAA